MIGLLASYPGFSLTENGERRSLGTRLWFAMTDYASLVTRPASRLHWKPGYDLCYMKQALKSIIREILD